jgi:hypothetical protein
MKSALVGDWTKAWSSVHLNPDLESRDLVAPDSLAPGRVTGVVITHEAL